MDDFWAVAILIATGATLAVVEGEPLIPTLAVAAVAAIGWYLVVNRQR